MNNRRKLMAGLSAGALTAPFAVLAQQQGKVWRVGFLFQGDPTRSLRSLEDFKLGMRELGYFENKNYVIEQRAAQDDLTRLSTLAAELVALPVDVILPAGTPSALAAHDATRDIPIVIAIVGDPVGIGLAASLRIPGGNVTGLSNISAELVIKRLDLLRQIVPAMRRVAFLYNPDGTNDTLSLRHFESTCKKLGLKSISVPLRKQDELEAAFKTMKHEKAQGLIVTATINWARTNIITHAANSRLPAMYPAGTWPEAGGLISYAANNPDLYRRAAAYVVKIFKGARPGDLPIEQPTKFDAVINLTTAKLLGIKIPQSILVQATKVIE